MRPQTQLFPEVLLTQNKTEGCEDSVNQIVSMTSREQRPTLGFREHNCHISSPRTAKAAEESLQKPALFSVPGTSDSSQVSQPHQPCDSTLTPAPQLQIPVSHHGVVEICSVSKFITQDISLRMRLGLGCSQPFAACPEALPDKGNFPFKGSLWWCRIHTCTRDSAAE